MQFLADVELVCDECKGTRYKPQMLEVRYKGKNIHEVLNLTVSEALQFFAERSEAHGKTARAGRSRPRLPPPRTVGDYALRRRSRSA